MFVVNKNNGYHFIFYDFGGKVTKKIDKLVQKQTFF